MNGLVDLCAARIQIWDYHCTTRVDKKIAWNRILEFNRHKQRKTLYTTKWLTERFNIY